MQHEPYPYECKCGMILMLEFQYTNKGVAIYQGVCSKCGVKNIAQIHPGRRLA